MSPNYAMDKESLHQELIGSGIQEFLDSLLLAQIPLSKM